MSLAERLSAAKCQLSATMTKITSVDGWIYVEENGKKTLQEEKNAGLVLHCHSFWLFLWS